MPLASVFAESFKILEAMHRDFVQALDGLPDAAVNWTPGADINSLGVLAVHVAGSERYWIGTVALNDPAPRDRSAEFFTKGLSAPEALERLQASLQYVQDALERLVVEDLSTVRTLSTGREVTVAYALLHVIEHTSMHAGHAQLMHQLWEAQAEKGH